MDADSFLGWTLLGEQNISKLLLYVLVGDDVILRIFTNSEEISSCNEDLECTGSVPTWNEQ